jgi:hypothetical protein
MLVRTGQARRCRGGSGGRAMIVMRIGNVARVVRALSGSHCRFALCVDVPGGRHVHRRATEQLRHRGSNRDQRDGEQPEPRKSRPGFGGSNHDWTIPRRTTKVQDTKYRAESTLRAHDKAPHAPITLAQILARHVRIFTHPGDLGLPARFRYPPDPSRVRLTHRTDVKERFAGEHVFVPDRIAGV